MPSLTAALRAEYRRLFATCVIRPNRAQQVETIIAAIRQNRSRYDAVAEATGVPWHVIGALHNMESSLDFSRHLHNGDPLTARTVRAPAGRPRTGNPPFTWEESAIDALTFKRLHLWADWSIAGTLYKLESYNGWGYRNYHPEVLSPYLWSFSNHYTRGKYVRDGQWSPVAVSSQCGAAVLLRRMAELGMIEFPAEPTGDEPLIRYAPEVETEYVRELQRFLNKMPGVFLREDGRAGRRTSDAFRKVTGYYLQGDPRV